MTGTDVCLPSANSYRAKHTSTPPLQWDAELEKKAQAYADGLLQKALAKNGEDIMSIFKHDPANIYERMGENVFYDDDRTGSVVDFCGEADKEW